MAFKMKGFSYPGVSPVKMKKISKAPPASKTKKQKYRTKMESEYMKDPDAFEKKYSKKQIDKDVAKADAITAKRASAKRGLKANQESGNVPGKKRSGMKLKKSPTKMMKKSPAKKTYDQAYDALSASEKKKYWDKSPTGNAREEFKKAARAYNKEKYGTTEPTKTAKSRNMTKKELAKSTKNVKDYDASNKAINKKAEVNASKKKKNVVTSKVTGEKAIDNRPKSKPTRKRTVVGKIATKAANLVRKNKKDPNRTLDKSNKKAEKKAAKVNKKLAKITAKREKISSKKDMTVKQARRANKRSAKLAEKANKIQAKAKKKILKK